MGKLESTGYYERSIPENLDLTDCGFSVFETMAPYFLSIVSFSKLHVLYGWIKIHSTVRERYIISATIINSCCRRKKKLCN
jgi:hypothetical protein